MEEPCFRQAYPASAHTGGKTHSDNTPLCPASSWNTSQSGPAAARTLRSLDWVPGKTVPLLIRSPPDIMTWWRGVSLLPCRSRFSGSELECAGGWEGTVQPWHTARRKYHRGTWHCDNHILLPRDHSPPKNSKEKVQVLPTSQRRTLRQREVRQVAPAYLTFNKKGQV